MNISTTPTRKPPRRRAAVTAAVLTLLGAFATAPAAAADGPSACQEVNLPVSLAPGTPAHYTVWGQLCDAQPGRTVEVLTHGITYSHTYWDWPYQPDTYSYVRAAGKQGRATFAYDRIGIGRSSHPDPVSVTIPANAYVLHQIVQALREHEIGPGFAKIVTVGHSLGSLISMQEAGQFNDVDGVVLTGISHSFVTVGVGLLFPDFVPAQLDPVLAPRNLPLGYVTTRAGTREEHFYYAPTADPAMVSLDEATKETGTAGELATIPVALPFTLSITAPVLLVDGDNDQLVCGTLPCSSPLSAFNAEPLLYPRAASYRQELIPGTGHDMTPQTTAPRFFAAVGDWLTRTLG